MNESEDTLFVPEEHRVLALADESFIIEVPGEWRAIMVPGVLDGQ
jgi:hypothetical protein